MYIVLEIQEEQDGRTRVLEPAYYEDKLLALQKYFTVLSYAAVSEMAKHASMIITPDGQVFRSECVFHVQEPEPEPEPVEENTEENMEDNTEGEIVNEQE